MAAWWKRHSEAWTFANKEFDRLTLAAKRTAILPQFRNQIRGP